MVTYPGSGNTFQEEWPLVGSSSGIFDDYLGDAFTVVASGSGPTATLLPGAAGTATMRVAGFAVTLPSQQVVNLSTVSVDGVPAVEPTGSQKRVDLLVARYDWSVADPDLAGTFAIRPGAPTATSTPLDVACPAPVRERGTLWEEPIKALSRPAGSIITVTQDRREWWSGDVKTVSDDSPGLGAAPVGALRFWRGDLWRRVVGVNGPTWANHSAAQRPVQELIVRQADGKVAAKDADGNPLEGVAVGPLTVPGAGRRIRVDAMLRLSQEQATGAVTIRSTINGVTMGESFGPFFVANGQEVFIPYHAISTSSQNNPTVPIVLRAKTTAGVLNIRAGTRMVVSAT